VNEPDVNQPRDCSTRAATIAGGSPGHGGYRRLQSAAGEPWIARTLDGSVPADPDGTALIAIAHLSDTHVMDCQSPARVEFLDRFLHPDVSLPSATDDDGRTYRPQESLTTAVLDAMAQSVAGTQVGPYTGRPLDLAIVTGDMTDSAQLNELHWLAAILDGGPVHPDSGDTRTFEGVGCLAWHDVAYWHPDGGPGDIARDRHGFPTAPGLLDAARRPFTASGLGLPWLAVYGNHDGLVQGTLAVSEGSSMHATGTSKAWRPGPGADARSARDLLDGIIDERTMTLLAEAEIRTVSADPHRRHLNRAEHVAWHVARGGHGFTEGNVQAGTAYYRHDLGPITFLVLDTVVAAGGWQGSLDEPQLHWLANELASADTDNRPVIIASHHTAADLVNDLQGPDAPRRILGAELLALLTAHPCVIAWLNGHTHTTSINAHGDAFWEITAPSLIDWPQQGRIVEVLRTTTGYAIVTTMLDHAGPVTWSPAFADTRDLAALSRELSANAWAAPAHADLADHPRAGRPWDRNAILHVRR